MNPGTLKEAVALAKEIAKPQKPATKGGKRGAKQSTANVDVVVCPPFPYLEKVAGALSLKTKSKKTPAVQLGAQDVFWQGAGPYTGEVSAAMLKEVGSSYVILGHSERRKFVGETDEMIAQKVKAALEAGLKVILCVGEGQAEREKGGDAAKKFVRKQIGENLKLADSVSFNTENLVLVYEPVWAISASGIGHPDDPEDAVSVMADMAEFLEFEFRIANTRIIYGGSVDSKNVSGFLQHEEIGGALVGAASLNADEFKRIIAAASGIISANEESAE